MFFERNCKYPITAEYSLNEDGNLNVTNKCADEKGEIDVSYGVAKQSYPDKNTIFAVNFLPKSLQSISGLISPNYYIIALTDDYQYAMVGSPSRKFLWILSRSDKPNKEIVATFKNQAKEMGFDTDKLIIVIE